MNKKEKHKERIDVPGLLYYVSSRGNKGRSIFCDEEDHFRFTEDLSHALFHFTKVYAWALLPDQFHLLIKAEKMPWPIQRPIERVMHRLLTCYAMYFNRKYSKAGRLFARNFSSTVVQEDRFLVELVRYIHLIPLTVKMVESIEEWEEYKWSGYQALTGKEIFEWQDKDYVLGKMMELDHELHNDPDYREQHLKDMHYAWAFLSETNKKYFQPYMQGSSME